MATGQLAPQAAAVTDVDRMPVHGIDHLELYVGNAAQAAFFFTRAFGFTETAYSGLETGRRDRVSHVLEQGRIRLVVTGTLAVTTRSASTTSATGTACTRSRSACPTQRRPTGMPSSTGRAG